MGTDDTSGFDNLDQPEADDEKLEAGADIYYSEDENTPTHEPTPKRVPVSIPSPKPKPTPKVPPESKAPVEPKIPSKPLTEKTSPGRKPSKEPPRRSAKEEEPKPALSLQGRIAQFVNRSILITLIVLSLAVIVAAAYRYLVGDELTDSNKGSPSSQAAASVATATPLPLGAWPADVVPAENTTPAMIKNTLSSPNEMQGYVFQGTAGKSWTITVEAIEDDNGQITLDPKVTVYDPSGQEVGSADDVSANDLNAELQITLPVTGPYRVLVQSSADGTTTGHYLLSLWVD